MGVSFLTKFGTTSVSPDACLVDFSDNCRGKAEEREDIVRNRENYVILDYDLGTPVVSSLAAFSSAEVRIPCFFRSRIVKCPAGGGSCVVGSTEVANGTCRLTAVYEQARWWLCESRFLAPASLSPAMRRFFGQ
jgi:hypothetical protein